MITRVWGLINGQQALQTYQKGDRWYFELPSQSGMFVCEFWAENDYGSVGYRSAIIYIQDGRVKCIRVLSERYHSLMSIGGFDAEMSIRDHTVAIKPFTTAIMADRRYNSDMEILVCPHNMEVAI